VKIPLSWLKEFVEVTVEPRRLADDLTLAGLAVDAVDQHEGDTVLELDITTNRVDAMNVYGVAREVATLYGLPLRPIETGPARDAGELPLRVDIEAPELCPRFCARVLDVRMGPSPSWLRERLERVGVRPISNVVDLTNYVMMEMGHPSHAFDLAKIPEQRLVVRWAKQGEVLKTLDGNERKLASRIGVVAGPKDALGLAGIMGGADSEVGDDTRTVALEAAWWDPLSIRRAAKALGMHTEASHRFERGADPAAPPTATARIGYLLEKIGAGTVRPGLLDVHPAPRPVRKVTLRPNRVSAVAGMGIGRDTSERILRRLGFEVADGGEVLELTVPTWRGDVNREVDVIEEVARHVGVDKPPATVPPSRSGPGLSRAQQRERALRELLVAAGLTEVMTHTLVPPSQPHELKLQNPLTEEQVVLRGSLLQPGLLQALATNLRHGRRDVAIFEIGRVFRRGAELADERRQLAVLMAGQAGGHWSGKARPVDVFDAKGLVEAIGRRLGAALRVEQREAVAVLHPGQSGVVLLGDRPIGHLGALHPDTRQQWDLREGAVVLEIEIEPLLEAEVPVVRTTSLPRFPAVTRDLSLLVDASTTASALEAAVREAAGPGLVSLRVADRYEGPPVPEGKVSLMLSLTLQDPSRTLTGDEVQAVVERVRAALLRHGAQVRGE
jgi:phenylalanyl-tRNA synthetase beta chain